MKLGATLKAWFPVLRWVSCEAHSARTASHSIARLYALAFQAADDRAATR